MGKVTIKKSLRRSSAKVLNFILLFSLIVPNVFAPAIVIAQDLDLAQKDSIAQIPIDESEDILEDGINTSIFEEEEDIPESTFENGIYTVNTVSTGEYVYPDNPLVKVNFTEITQEGNLVIERVILTEEEKVELNTTESFAWDITSSMSNGSFKYDLTLPNSLGNDIEVKYSEDGSTYVNTGEFTVNEGSIVITDLDHFTTFVVVPSGTIPTGVTEGTTEVDGTCNISSSSGMYCYDSIQEAINAAIKGDTINVLAGEYEISNTIDINKELTIVGASGAKLINIDTPAKSVFSITSSNVTIEGFEITHQNAFVQDSNEVARALISIPDNASLTNIEIADNTIYGNYPAGTAQKDMYARGITVGSNGGTGIDISNNTIHSVRNGVVVRPTNTTNTNDNTIFNTKGGIMHYTSSFADADNRIILNNEWTSAHNEWDIVWNSATYGFPDYQESVIGLGELNNGAFILDLRRETSGGASALEGNRNPVFVTTTGADTVHQSTGNMNDPFATIKFAIQKVAEKGTIYIGNGSFIESGQIVIYKNVSIIGSGVENTTILPLNDTGGYGDNRGWILINSTSNLNLQELTLDGLGKNIYQAIRSYGTGTIQDINIKNIIYPDYQGTGIVLYGNMLVQNNSFENIGRIGIFPFGSGSTDSRIINNVYLGKGDGDWLDYGIEVGGGAVVEIRGNEISNCTGIASSDNSHSGAIFVSTYFGDGTIAEIYENELYDNYYGIIAGYNSSDTSVVSAHYNNIFDNDYGFRSTSQEIQAQNNWWGHLTGPSGDASGLGDRVNEHILYQEWLCEPYTELGSIKSSVDGVCSLPNAPEQIGYNVNDGTPNTLPTRYSCSGEYTNVNGASIHWTNVSGGDSNIKYQRQYKVNNGSWVGNEIYSNPYTNYRSFGGGTGNDGIYGSQVRAFYDTNEDGQYNVGEPVSEWSNECSIIFDKTPPSTPSLFAPVNNLFTNVNFIKLEWTGGDDTLSGTKGYILGYTFTPADGGTISTWDTELRAVGNPYWHSGTYGHGEGKYVFWVKTIDNAGNESEMSELLTVTYDKTNPLAPTNLYFWDLDNNKAIQCGGYSNTHHINEHWDENLDEVNLSHYEYSSFDAPSGSAGLVKSVFNTNYFNSSWWNIPIEGTYGFQVRTLDKAGNTSPWALNDIVGIDDSCKITIDWTAPVVSDITITKDGNPVTYVKAGDTIKIRATVIDQLSGVKAVSADFSYNSPYTNRPTPRNTTMTKIVGDTYESTFAIPVGWNEGDLYLTVAGLDNVGNYNGNRGLAQMLVIDNTAPTGSIDALVYPSATIPNFITNDNNPTITGTMDDDRSGIRSVDVTIDGNSPLIGDGDPNVWTVGGFPTLADGIHTIQAIIEDNAGNTVTLTQLLTVDTKAPTATHTYLKDGVTTTDTTYVKGVNQLSFTAQYFDEDPSSGILKDSYVIFDSNEAGTARTSKAYCGWRNPANTLMITDNPITTPVQFTDCEPTLPDGGYFMYHQVYDNATRKDIPTITQFKDVKGLHFIVDTVAPVVEITNPSDNQYVKGTVDFKGTVEDTNLLRYYYFIQNTTSKTVTTSVNLSDETIYTWNTKLKPDGVYQMRLEARDKANNKDNNLSVDIISVIVDNAVPTVQSLEDFTINEGALIPTKSVLVEDNYEIDQFCYSITSDIGDLSETCILPSGSTNNWNIDFTDTILTELSNTYGITTTIADTSILPEGDYTISYFAKDKAGNSSLTEEVVVTIQNVLPSVLFSSTSTTILAGGTVTFNGSFTDPGLDDSDWTYTLNFGDGTANHTGTTGVVGSIITNLVHQYTEVGTYTATLEVCESSLLCNSADIEITVNPLPEPEEETLGVTTDNTKTKPPTVLKRATRYVADVLGIGGGDEEEVITQLPEETDDSEVKGSQTCENPKTLSGYVYIDENENGMRDEDEKIFSDVSLRIYMITDGIEETIKQVVTDENGMWEVKLCMGEYFVSLDSDTLPNRYVVDGEDIKGINITDMDSKYNLNYQILDERTFLQKYWPWILLVVGVIGTGVIVVVDSKRKKAFV